MAKGFLKHYFFTYLVALAINGYTWLVYKFCKIELNFNKQTKGLLDQKTQCLLVYWHSRILMFPKFMAKYGNFCAVVSTHADAEYLAIVLKLHGHQLIRGSSRKNSLSAMMGVIKQIKAGQSIAITPDGPKGPRFKIKGSVVQISKKYGLPIISSTYSASRAIVFKSWDRFILPIPFISKIKINVSEPLYPKNLSDNKTLENFMLKQVKAADSLLGLKVDYK